MMKPLLKIFLCLMSISLAARSQEKWNDYVGAYFIDSVDAKGFDSFYSFKLEPASYWKYMDTTSCTAVWFPKDNPHSDSCTEVNFVELYLQNDSLFFRTAPCHHERYEFFGKFTMPATQFADHLSEPILKGELLYWLHNRLFQRIRVTFTYDFGGD